MSICKFGKKKRRTISWSDDGRQPEDDELLLSISFATGAYIFSDDYPETLFKDFFNELASYAPKYKDTVNKCLYFSMDNAGKIFNDFDAILAKYKSLNKEDFKKRKIEKLKKELETLSLKD